MNIECSNITEHLGKEIGKGSQGSVYNHKFDSSKVIKKSKSMSKDKLKAVKTEYEIAKEGGILGVSPVIYEEELLVCKPNPEKELYNGYIIMDKIQGKEIERVEQVEQYFDRLIDKIKILQENGISYPDYNAGNIMIGKLPNSDVEDVYLIDYGACKRKDSAKIKINKKKIRESLLRDITPVVSKKISPATIEKQRKKASEWAASNIKTVKKSKRVGGRRRRGTRKHKYPIRL